ncbi:hypothetical protein METBIDRAFT_35851 [Metschnikowia bicuspidata var. bicuspidata NRRL YB-4993]|uniref:Anaphase-promoting complex subunit 1 N-terminal domain-containing protein n=1 Tax=Metschnikowia bicuspidata var. bicuspidata NRRL YB-4993 TaxID=869754 RepID=A0A1A0HHN5_9ASCO|nr:hypothetical protein METBIDRAFT_35851 [Metschnikowia bicuspidata var. bicuspidata NRRL YB-4993]OBA23392.1 hypothetical protein METBIDRAFT_35851 [Metschnikowia bicuspidata var. bicuspidata NRRL YB-4993]
MPLSLPALDISSEMSLPSLAKHRTFLFSHGRKLVVFPREVIVATGAIISRKLIYDEDIVGATYTTFQHDVSEGIDALVVCLKSSAHIYLQGGNSHIVCFPFSLKAVFPFESGLLLERENDQLSSHGHFLPYRFFTLVDPIGDLRVVTTSSTSVVTAGESLVYFPLNGLGKSFFLCVTFNARQRSVNVYHVKEAVRNKVVGSNALRRKRNMSMATPNPSRILEDELYESIQPPFASSLQLSINMDKKRTSTLLSGASSIARMGSESGLSEQSKPIANHGSMELGTLRKDMIWTKVDTFAAKARTLHLTVSGLIYEDKEAIVISNRATKQATIYIYKLTSGSMPHYHSSMSIDCHHALSLNHPSFPGWLLLLENSNSLQLIHPILEITSPSINFPETYAAILSIASTADHLVALRSATETRDSIYINIVLEPRNKLVLTCLKIWKYLSGSKLNESVWVLWRSAILLENTRDDWKAYVITILSLIYPFDTQEDPEIPRNEITELIPAARMLHEAFTIDYLLHDLFPYIVVSLHLVYEETRLNALKGHQLTKLGILLTQLTTWMGWLEHWTSYYMIDQTNIDKFVKLLLISLVYNPPNIFEHLISLFEHRRSRFLQISQLVEEGDEVNKEITPRTNSICEIFSLLASKRLTPNVIVKACFEYGLSPSKLESLPTGVRIPLKNCLLCCQKDPEFEWNSSIFDLVGRRDLPLLSKPDRSIPESNVHLHSLGNSNSRDANSIADSLSNKHDYSMAWDEQSEADRLKITKLMFDKDRRFFEITTLLHQTRIQTTNLNIKDGMSEYDSTLLKRETASLVALRTLTIPLGRAALFYAGRVPLLTEKFPISKFNLNTLIAPSMTTIVLEEGSLHKKVTDWGHFHNGVSSGLSISPSASCISGSWVIYNKPAENNAQHAGFLLGLGLNGHLKLLEEWHIYNYLGPKHPLTSVGLLIGMAASMKGTMENKLTKVLSVHAVALLPQGANDLNVPTIVQSAGLVGIGLLYLETQHRRMSEILLSQLGEFQPHADNHDEEESYKLAAGIALGFINLGKGDDLKGLNDTHVVNKLLSYAISMKDAHSEDESDKSSSGAIIALGFIYLRTRNATIATKLQIPTSEQLLDYVRPDLLLLRCLCRNLILWDNIQPTRMWVESQIPDVLLKRHDINALHDLDSDQINMFNILGGACLSVAIKYASLHDVRARDVILHYLDITMVISVASTDTYDQKLSLSSVCQLQDLLCLCLSVVMAGSGDIEVFRRLRVLHGRIHKNFDFGAHMATSMALGILFLGGSQYGFGDTNFAIAALIVSLYPVFPNEDSEIEVHLQVLRHFWALSIQPRCLVVRDVKDGSPIKLPVRIGYKDGSIKEAESPVLLGDMSRILSIQVDSESYFKVSIDFLVNSGYLEQFKNSLTIFVLRKLNYELLKASVGSLLDSKSSQLHITEGGAKTTLRKLLNLKLRTGSSSFEKGVYIRESGLAIQNRASEEVNSGLSIFNIFDDKLELTHNATAPKRLEDVLNLKLLIAYADCKLLDEHFYLDVQFIETIKRSIWEITH